MDPRVYKLLTRAKAILVRRATGSVPLVAGSTLISMTQSLRRISLLKATPIVTLDSGSAGTVGDVTTAATIALSAADGIRDHGL